MKRALSDRVSNSTVDDLLDTAMRAGAIGGKLLGAGRWWFHAAVRRAVTIARGCRNRCDKLITVPFTFEMSGSRIVLYQPDGLVTSDYPLSIQRSEGSRGFDPFSSTRSRLAR